MHIVQVAAQYIHESRSVMCCDSIKQVEVVEFNAFLLASKRHSDSLLKDESPNSRNSPLMMQVQLEFVAFFGAMQVSRVSHRRIL